MNTTPSPAIEAREHELKCWPGPFDAMAKGLKTFEFRKNDRDFAVGDTLSLRRFQPIGQQYTGEVMDRTITHILRNGFGVPDGYCVMSLDSPLLAAKQEELDKMAADNEKLRKALMPFSRYFCSPPGECLCNNCVARDLLASRSL